MDGQQQALLKEIWFYLLAVAAVAALAGYAWQYRRRNRTKGSHLWGKMNIANMAGGIDRQEKFVV